MRGALGRFAAAEPPEKPAATPVTQRLPVNVSASRAKSPEKGGCDTDTLAPKASHQVIGQNVTISDMSDSASEYEGLRATALVCRRCRLCETRTHVVFGEGSLRPRLMVIGEAPGADEDATGRPFVGKAGQLLTRMLAAIGLGRDDVYIANVLKCRPPENRPPAPDEILACRPYLREQIERLRPDLLLLLGNHATRAVLATDRGITSLRGTLMASPEGWATLPTYHPAYLLRNPDAKREAWADLQLAAATLGLALPGRPQTP